MREAAVSPYLFFLLKTVKWGKKISQRQVKAQSTDLPRPSQKTFFRHPPPPKMPNYILLSTRQLRGDLVPISLFCLGLKWTFHLNPLIAWPLSIGFHSHHHHHHPPKNRRLGKNKGVWGGSEDVWKGEQRGRTSRKEIVQR